MAFFHGVLPILLKNEQKREEEVHKVYQQIENELLGRKLARKGDRFIVLNGIKGPENKWMVNAINVHSID